MKNELKVLVGDFQRRYDMLDFDQQQKLRVRTAQILSVGTAITVVGALYPFVPLVIRLFAIPLLVVGSWYLAGKLAKKEGAFESLLERLKHAPTLVVLGSLMMVAFLFAGLIWGAR